jgi:hypothetical protein
LWQADLPAIADIDRWQRDLRAHLALARTLCAQPATRQRVDRLGSAALRQMASRAFAVRERLEYSMGMHRRTIGKGEADVTRIWLSVIALGALAACSDPNRAPGVIPDTSPPPPESTAPAADSGLQNSAPGTIPPGPMTDNRRPDALDANPPGTPSYVIAPGDPTGRRSGQIPHPGGRPAF